MADRTWWEAIKGESETIVEKLKNVIHEGNVRRIVVPHHRRGVAAFTQTARGVGARLAPVVAAVAALVALLKDCTIEVERSEAEPAEKEATGGAPRG